MPLSLKYLKKTREQRETRASLRSAPKARRTPGKIVFETVSESPRSANRVAKSGGHEPSDMMLNQLDMMKRKYGVSHLSRPDWEKEETERLSSIEQSGLRRASGPGRIKPLAPALREEEEIIKMAPVPARFKKKKTASQKPAPVKPEIEEEELLEEVEPEEELEEELEEADEAIEGEEKTWEEFVEEPEEKFGKKSTAREESYEFSLKKMALLPFEAISSGLSCLGQLIFSPVKSMSIQRAEKLDARALNDFRRLKELLESAPVEKRKKILNKFAEFGAIFYLIQKNHERTISKIGPTLKELDRMIAGEMKGKKLI